MQLPTQAQVDVGTATGSTGASLTPTPALLRSKLLSDYVADSGAANAYVIAPTPTVTALVAGTRLTFKVTTSNTAASTVVVNALSGTAIFRNDGAKTVLGSGDLVAGQIVEIEYNGVDGFVLTTPVAGALPSGSIQMYAGATAPSGWLLCDATSYLRTDYPSLFAVISTTYGNADGTHFNVPDMRGRTPVGVGTGTGGGSSGTGLPAGGSALTAVARGTWKGEETHTLITSEMPAHTHSYATTSGAGANVTSGANLNSSASATTGSTGGDGAHNNLQPFMGVSFIIKT